MSLTSASSFLFVILSLVVMIPVYADSEECLTMRKTSTQEFYCVSPSSVEKLYERGWGTPGKAWGNICSEYTVLDDDGICMIQYRGIGCQIPKYQESCLQIDTRPTTTSDCLDKYYFAYRMQHNLEGIKFVISPSDYASKYCALYPDVEMHGKDCMQWWSNYQVISRESSDPLDELGFIHVICLKNKEPDWNAFGILHIENPDLNTRWINIEWPIEASGFLDDLFSLVESFCREQSCIFSHQNGINSTIQCDDPINHGVNTTQFVQDPITLEYSCQNLPNPDFDCPDYEYYNGTRYYDIWFDDGTLRYGCTLVKFVDSDRDGVNDDVDECLDLKEDDYSKTPDGCPSN